MTSITTPLKTRSLGHSGMGVSVLGLGTNQFGSRLNLQETRAVLDGAIDAGVTFLDCADAYGATKSEAYIGEALKGRRQEVLISTKFGADLDDGWEGPRGRPDYIMHAADESLRRLQTDVIDLYWYHRPDGVTPILETMVGLNELVRVGKVRAIGGSNFSAAQIREADDVAKSSGFTRFTAIENEYSLLNREVEEEVLPLCEELDVAFIPYFPLARGLLTGKYQRGLPGPDGARLSDRDTIATDSQWNDLEALTQFAHEQGVPLPHVAIGALLAQPAVASVIAGATRADQVRANATATQWIPSDADLATISSILA